MRIRINVYDPDSIEQAIQKVEEYKRSLQSKMNEIVSRLSRLGAQVVDYQYSLANDDPDFDTADYEVSCIVNGNSAMIIAEGSDIMFIEFGAGVRTEDTTGEMQTEGLPPITPGSYSQTEGIGQFIPGKKEFWFHGSGANKKFYRGLTPYHGFYFASKEMKEQAVDIAIKVFKR